jgi:UDP-glucose 4-epimerase
VVVAECGRMNGTLSMTSFAERRKRRILVTGAGGLIGSETCRQLFEAGYHVLALYRNEANVSETLPWDKHFFDLETEGACIRLHSLLPLYGIVHCAAVIPSVFQGEEALRASIRNANIDNAIKILRFGVGKLIYCSSSSVYAASYSRNIVIDELTPVEIQGPYQQEKVTTENDFINLFSNKSFIFRICAPYASNQKRRTVLKSFIDNALEGRDLTYYGSGTRQQNFTHVKDIARAILRTLESETQGGIFNIAGGSPVSMRELAELIVRIIPYTGSKVIPSGQKDPQEGWAALFSIEKAARELGWSPCISLEEGIRDWVEHIQKGIK